MKNRITMLLSFLAAFLFATTAVAGATEDTAGTGEAAAVAEPSEGATSTGGETVAGTEDAATDTASDAAASAEITSDEEAVEAITEFIAAMQEGHWPLVLAFAIMLLVYVVNRLKILSKLGPKALPWVATTTGVLGYVAAALMVDGTSITEGALNGVVAGAAAVGLWEMLFKHFLGRK